MDTTDHPVAGADLATFAYQKTPAVLACALRAHYRWRLLHSWSLPVMALVYGVLGFVIGWSYNQGWLPAVIGGLLGMIAGAVLHLATWALLYVRAPAVARRNFRQRRDMPGEIQVTLTENGMRAVTKLADSYTAWENYIAWGQDPCVLRLYVSRVLFLFIPTDAIPPEAQAVFDSKLASLPRR